MRRSSERRKPRVRTGQGSVALTKQEFRARVGERFYEPYATSHDELDADADLHEEVRNAARSLVNMVRMIRSGRYVRPDRGLSEPRPK